MSAVGRFNSVLGRDRGGGDNSPSRDAVPGPLGLDESKGLQQLLLLLTQKDFEEPLRVLAQLTASKNKHTDELAQALKESLENSVSNDWADACLAFEGGIGWRSPTAGTPLLWRSVRQAFAEGLEAVPANELPAFEDLGLWCQQRVLTAFSEIMGLYTQWMPLTKMRQTLLVRDYRRLRKTMTPGQIKATDKRQFGERENWKRLWAQTLGHPQKVQDPRILLEVERIRAAFTPLALAEMERLLALPSAAGGLAGL